MEERSKERSIGRTGNKNRILDGARIFLVDAPDDKQESSTRTLGVVVVGRAGWQRVETREQSRKENFVG